MVFVLITPLFESNSMEYEEIKSGVWVVGYSNWELVEFGVLFGNEGVQSSYICLDGVFVCVSGKFECIAFDCGGV